MHANAWRRSGWSFFLIASVVLFFVTTYHAIQKPLSGDEVEFAGAGFAIFHTGKPLYYLGDHLDSLLPSKDWWVFRESPQRNYQYGLWHSTFYPYLIAFSYFVFGTSAGASRIPGLFCLLLTFVLLVRLAAHTKEVWDRQTLAWFGFLFLTHPFLVQGSLSLDLDNTVVALTSVLFLHEYIRLESKHASGTWPSKLVLWFSVLVALSFWSKEYAPAFLVVPAALYELANRRWDKIFQLFIAFVLGSVLFVTTWYLFCRAFDLPPDYFLRFTFGRRGITESGGWMKVFSSPQDGLPWWKRVQFPFLLSFSWVSPYLFALGASVLYWRARKFLLGFRAGPVDLLFLYSLCLLFVTKILRPDEISPKYEYPAYAPLLLVLALYARQSLGLLSRKSELTAAVFIAALAWLHFRINPDPVLTLAQARLGLIPYTNPFWLYALTVVLLFLVLRLFFNVPYKSAVASLLLGFCAHAQCLNYSQREPYITSISWTESYGERGQKEIVEHVLKSVPADARIMTRKDMGFAIALKRNTPEFRWLEIITHRLKHDEPKLLDELQRHRIDYFVAPALSIGPRSLPVVNKLFFAEKQFGTFFLLRRRYSYPGATPLPLS